METLPAVVPSLNFTWLFVKMLGVLAILVFILFVFGKYLLPRFGKASWTTGRRGLISVVERLSLEPRKNIYLLKVAKKHLLIGTTDHTVNFLGEVKNEEMD